MPGFNEQEAIFVDEGDDSESIDVVEILPTEREIEKHHPQYPDEVVVHDIEIPEETPDLGNPKYAPKEELLVSEDDIPVPEVKKDTVPGSDAIIVEEEEADARDEKPKNWADDKEHAHFIAYIFDRKNNIPRHSGETVPGCERAKSYLKSLDNEISQAMRTDLEGVIDESQIDALRKEIENMIDRLDTQISKLKKKTRKADVEVRLVSTGQCEKCNSAAPMWHDVANDKDVCMHCESEVVKEDGIEKTAATPILNVYVSAFERAVVGTIINAALSGGKNIEEVYERMKNKYNFNPREELAVTQLIADYGYPVFRDRGLMNEPTDPASGANVEWQTNYQA